MSYAFGIFEFDAETGELTRSGRPVRLEPQPARALGLLLLHAGDIVLREQLIAHVWGSDTHVDFNRGLAYCIAEIRGALGDSADNPRFIQTLPKRGFRFIAPVQSTAENSARGARSNPAPPPLAESLVPESGVMESSPQRSRLAAPIAAIAAILALGVWALVGRGGVSRPVIAVSVFDNETGDSRYDLPVRTLSDTVVDRLTRIGPERLGVVGNEAVLRMPRSERDLRKIADQTGAEFVVLAQLQRRDPELSLLIHLIRLDDGTHVWTRRVGRPPEEPLTGLDDEAARLVDAAAREFVIRGGPLN